MLATVLFLLYSVAIPPVASAAPNYAIPVLDIEGDTIASAALIARNQALTASHTVPGLNSGVFLKCGKDLVFGKVSMYDKGVDLALVTLLSDCNTVTVLAIAPENALEGTPLIIQGYAGGGPRKLTSGVVSGYDTVLFEKHADSRFVMLSDVTIAGGNSGGPAVANNLLIGIVQAKFCINSPRGVVPACYAILAPVSVIRDFLHATIAHL